MTNQTKKFSELPVAQTAATTDRLVLVYNVIGNTAVGNGSPQTQTIALSNLVSSVIIGPYDTDTAAQTGGVALHGLYYTSLGVVKIRLV